MDEENSPDLLEAMETKAVSHFKAIKAMVAKAVSHLKAAKAVVSTLNDLKAFKSYLIIVRRGYHESEITVLSDDHSTSDNSMLPYTGNILREMEKLYEDQEDGDHYVFYYTKEEDDEDENMAVLIQDGETLHFNEDEGTHFPRMAVIDNVSMRSTDV
ncbi:hypothetical protein DXG01_010019 [Tephrocybe rancida]|nr:hypothetical protein DXG01_010019 [Tephrocybe rancida]